MRQKQTSRGPARVRHAEPDATLQPVRPPAAAALVLELTERNFASLIDGHRCVVIDFRHAASAAAAAFTPVLAAAAQRHPAVLFARVDTATQQSLCAQFQLQAAPTLVIVRDNVLVHARSGALSAAQLDAVLATALALDMADVRRHVDSADAVVLGVPSDAAPAAADAGLRSIEDHLHPALRGAGSALNAVMPRLAAGELVVVRNAFEPDFAERMHRSLDACRTWRLYERYDEHFHFHHHSLYEPDDFPPDLAWCSALFDAAGTKAWIARLSGRDCAGPAEVGASWYLPGDHSLPHNDVADCGANIHRQVAFVWHLAKDWQPQWGGALYWCPKAAYLAPTFNTLYLFNVGPESAHFVTTVSPFAQGKRLAVNGWWTGPAAPAAPNWQGPDRVGGNPELLVY